MTTVTGPRNQDVSTMRSGTVTLVLGVCFAASVAWIFVLSLTDVDAVPNWVRALGSVGMPIGLVGVPFGFSLARGGDGMARARLGVLIAAVALLALVGLMVALG